MIGGDEGRGIKGEIRAVQFAHGTMPGIVHEFGKGGARSGSRS